MIKRNIYSSRGRGGMTVSDQSMQDIILDTLKEQDDYFVDCEFVKEYLEEFYNDYFNLQRIQKILNRLCREKLVIMKHTLRPGHKKYFSHPDNHLNKIMPN